MGTVVAFPRTRKTRSSNRRTEIAATGGEVVLFDGVLVEYHEQTHERGNDAEDSVTASNLSSLAPRQTRDEARRGR